jgi:acetyl-CoA carboxylase carboxyltransferase component
VVEPSQLRAELIARFAAASGKPRHRPHKHHGVPPV